MKKISIKQNKLFFLDEEAEENNNRNNFIPLTKQMITDFNLKNKEALSEDEYLALISYRIKLAAYNMLAKKDYSKKDLFDKLVLKYGNKNIVKDIIETCVQDGYLDDYNFCISYINTHNYGIKKMEYIFQLKEIDKDIISKVLEELKLDQIEKIRTIINKDKTKDKDKLISQLLRKGYEYRDIKKVFSEME